MTRVKLVEQNNVVRVVAMSEHAIEKTCNSWQEAMEYCDEKQYTVDNMDTALSRLLDTADVPGDDVDRKPGDGGEHIPAPEQSNGGADGDGTPA